MEITYYGHACFLVKIGDHKILFDPFISPNQLASKIDVNKIEADYILLSHGHEDHVADAEQIAKRTGATIVSNFEITTWYNNKGIEKTHPMNHGGKKHFEFGTVKMMNAVHSSSMPDGSYGGNPVSYVIETAKNIFYFAGDTALHYEMKLIGDQNKLDFAMLPIGDNFTMDINDAVVAAEFLNTKKIFGMHYDTFPYIEIDCIEATMIAKKNNKELILMDIGESQEI